MAVAEHKVERIKMEMKECILFRVMFPSFDRPGEIFLCPLFYIAFATH